MRLSFTARPVPALATPRQAPAGAFPPGQVGPVRLASGPQPSGYPRYPAPVTVQTTYSRPEAQTYRPPERRVCDFSLLFLRSQPTYGRTSP
jgi:hypothetical protein